MVANQNDLVSSTCWATKKPFYGFLWYMNPQPSSGSTKDSPDILIFVDVKGISILFAGPSLLPYQVLVFDIFLYLCWERQKLPTPSLLSVLRLVVVPIVMGLVFFIFNPRPIYIFSYQSSVISTAEVLMFLFPHHLQINLLQYIFRINKKKS